MLRWSSTSSTLRLAAPVAPERRGRGRIAVTSRDAGSHSSLHQHLDTELTRRSGPASERDR
jgi:hypothetical protein